MMNAKNFKKMNDCDLDIVIGGTVAELEGLLKACYNNPHLQKFVGIGVHVPSTAIATAYLMENTLDSMGIDANISVGICGTGAFSKHNTYYDRTLGRRLSQSEVEDRLRQYVV